MSLRFLPAGEQAPDYCLCRFRVLGLFRVAGRLHGCTAGPQMGSNRGRVVTQTNSQHQDLNPVLFCYGNIRSVHKSEITGCDRTWMLYRRTQRGPFSAKPIRAVRESANRTFASSSGPFRPSTNTITPPPTNPSTPHDSGHSHSIHTKSFLCTASELFVLPCVPPPVIYSCRLLFIFYTCTAGVEHPHFKCTCTMTVKTFRAGIFIAVVGSLNSVESLHRVRVFLLSSGFLWCLTVLTVQLLLSAGIRAEL